MSVVWQTAKGNLGIIPESQFFSYQLEATDTDEQSLFYSVISGDLPGGMYVNRSTGEIRGIPSIQSTVTQSLSYAFTVRATNPNGVLADRSFSLVVSNTSGPEIFPKPDLIGAWFDGNYLDYTFYSINNNSAAQETWSLIKGDLPPGTTLSPNGRLSGYVSLIAANTDELGYEANAIDTLGFDILPKSKDKYYNFIVQVTDGAKFNTVNVRALIVSKGSYTADNFITLINNTFINVDADNKYRPIIINTPQVTTVRTLGNSQQRIDTVTTTYEYPTLVSGDTFAYKMIAYDPEDEPVSWTVDEFQFSGMDELDAAQRDNLVVGTGIVGPYTLSNTPVNAAAISVRINGKLLIPLDDYSVTGNQLTFSYYSISGISRVSNVVTITTATHNFVTNSVIKVASVTDTTFNGTFTVTGVTPTTITYNQIRSDASASSGTVSTYAPSVSDEVEIYYIVQGPPPLGKGFDTLLFDQGIEGLPVGVTISQNTGWLYGTLPAQSEDEKIYNLRIKAYRRLMPSYISDPVTFSFKVKRTLNEEISWTTPFDLGTINNGSVSELAITAKNTLGKELEYKLVYNPYKRIPQGLKLLPTGRFIGRVTFRYFSLDGSVGRINLISTAGINVGMNIQGVGIAAGCEVTAIIDNNQIEVRPAIYVSQGTVLTFSDLYTTTVASTNSNAISTAIDGGGTTFDQDCYFTVKAEALDGSISSEKNFVVTIDPRNLAPYENLWLKALPSKDQRLAYKDLIEDQDLFPTSVLYRPDDPYFGVRKNLRIQFLSGLSPAQISAYTTAIERNHYTKTINFGEIKTARAVDTSGNIVYEIVYAEAVDTQSYATSGPLLSTDLNITNGYLNGTTEYKTIYPNSFNNMQYRIDNEIGYTNRGALPTWMTSVQENGQVLGPIKAIILAYVQPGAGKLVQYRLKNTPKFPAGNFSFVADRYQWENYLSKFYDVTNSIFLPSRDTTFDKYPSLGQGSDVIITAFEKSVTTGNTIVIGNNLLIGEGWQVSGIDSTSTITSDTYITKILGNTITVSKTVTGIAGSRLKIEGTARSDYAVSTYFSNINGSLKSRLVDNGLIDGIRSFQNNETLIFTIQEKFSDNLVNDGWVLEDGVTGIPGYLDRLSGASTVNQRGGIWAFKFNSLSGVGFDGDEIGFDSPSPGLFNGYFDQGDDIEVHLEFVQELIVNQTIKIRTGKTYPASTLQYKLAKNEAIPRYQPFEGTLGSAQTTFDGGSCLCREGDERGGIRGGTAFSNNRDKYEVPESLDKYIKFPQDGVFV
jgi:hypothetical protein